MKQLFQDDNIFNSNDFFDYDRTVWLKCFICIVLLYNNISLRAAGNHRPDKVK